MAKRTKAEKPVSQEFLLSILSYDQSTGILTWKERPRSMFLSERIYRSWNAKMSGKSSRAKPSQNGYVYISINGKRHLAHRIIFKMMTGRDPVGVDHINGDPVDNRWINLREADQSLNAKNAATPKHNTSGHIGVGWLASRSRWIAGIKVNGRQRRIGYFKTKEEAIAARKKAEIEHGFHPNHGRCRHA